MPIPVFPIPEQKPSVQQVDERIQLQDDVLEGLYATAQAAVDSRINSQASALVGIANTALGAVDRRIKQQSKLFEPIVGRGIAAVDDAIARQGAQLAIHSEVFPRTYPAPQDTPSSLGSASVPFAPFLRGTSPSSGIGVSSQSLGVTPANIGIGGEPTTDLAWMVLVDCSLKTITLHNASEPNFLQTIRNGAFVPIRYGSEQSLRYNFMGLNFPEITQYFQGWIDIACNARSNSGAGWPSNGDFIAPLGFQSGIGAVPLDLGQPVGGWPFNPDGSWRGP